MMLYLLVAIVILFWLFTYSAPFGKMLFDFVSKVEARLCGFVEQKIQTHDTLLSVYDNQKENDRVIILLHGFSSNKQIWNRFALQFARDYRVISIDVAGHGESEFDTANKHDIPSQAQRVIEVAETLGIDAAIIMGNSMGGAIATEIALQQPSLSKSLVLIDPAGQASTSPSLRDTLFQQGRNVFLINDDDQFLEFYSMTMAAPPWIPKAVKRAVADIYISRKQELEQMYLEFTTGGFSKPISGVRCPVLLIWGQKDQILDVTCISAWQTQLPNISVEIYDELGHMPMYESPRRAAETVKHFISSID